MKHVLTIALGLALAFLFNPTEAHAQAATRTSAQTDLLRALNGSPQFLGRIAATTTAADNSTTASSFIIPKGSVLLVTSSSAACILAATTAAAGTVKCDGTANTGMPIRADEKLYVILMTNEGWLQAITASGTANVDVWRLR